MGEGKSEGTLRTSRSSIGQEQIDGLASIADDFNSSVNSQETNLISTGQNWRLPKEISKLR